MQTLGQLMHLLDQGPAKSFSQVVASLSNLPVNIASKTSFAQLLGVTKFVNAEFSVSDTTKQCLDQVNSAWESFELEHDGFDLSRPYDTREEAFDSYSDALALWRRLRKLAHHIIRQFDFDPQNLVDDDYSFDAITINGSPLHFDLIVDWESVGFLRAGWVTSSGFTSLFEIGLSVFDDEITERNTFLYWNPEALLPSGERFSWDAVLENATSTFITNSCIKDLFVHAQATGSLKVQQIKDILDRYTQTDAILTIKEYIAGLDELSSQSVVMLIARVLSLSQGELEQGNNYYSPYNTPGYCDDVLALVGTVLITVLATVLSIVFKVVGAIVMMLGSIITTIVDLINRYGTQVDPSVIRYSDVPVWNYPLGPSLAGELVEGAYSGRLPRTFFDQLQDFFPEYGSACYQQEWAASPGGVIYWAFPSGEGKVSIQPLVLATRYDIKSIPNFVADYYIQGSYSNTYLFAPPSNFRPGYSQSYVTTSGGDSTAYLSQSGSDLLLSFGRNVLFEFANAATMLYGELDTDLPEFHAAELPRHLSDVIDLISNLSVEGQNTGNNGADLLNHWGISTSEWRNVGHISDPARKTYVSTCQAMLFWMVYGSLMVTDNFTTPISTGADLKDADQLTALMQWGPTGEVITAALYRVFERIIAVPSMTGHELPWLPGGPVVNPSVEFPSVSRNAILTAAFVTALVAGAVTVTAVSIKRVAKRKALAKVAVKEAEMMKAKQDVLTNPNDGALQAKLLKSNRQFTRAKNRAARLGISYQSGFVSASTATGNTLSDLVPSNPDVATLVKLITGVDTVD